MKKTTAQPLRGIGRRALPAAMAALLALAMAPRTPGRHGRRGS